MWQVGYIAWFSGDIAGKSTLVPVVVGNISLYRFNCAPRRACRLHHCHEKYYFVLLAVRFISITVGPYERVYMSDLMLASTTGMNLEPQSEQLVWWNTWRVVELTAEDIVIVMYLVKRLLSVPVERKTIRYVEVAQACCWRTYKYRRMHAFLKAFTVMNHPSFGQVELFLFNDVALYCAVLHCVTTLLSVKKISKSAWNSILT